MRTDEFLTDVRRTMGAPNYQARFSPTDILDIASSQQINFIVPEIRALRRDFFVESEDFALAQGLDSIEIPERAAGRGIREIWFTDATNPTVGDWRKLRYVDLSDILNLGNTTGEVSCYYFQADDIKVYPAAPRASTIRLFYLSRPGNLVLPSRTATVLSVGSDTLTVDAVPANIALGSAIDVVKYKGSFRTLVKDKIVTARASNSVTVTGFDFTAAGVSVGDILSLARETSVVQLPEDAQEVLVSATCQEMAASLGIEEMTQRMEKQLKGTLNGMRQAFAPRSEDPQVIINQSSLLRAGYSRFGALLR